MHTCCARNGSCVGNDIGMGTWSVSIYCMYITLFSYMRQPVCCDLTLRLLVNLSYMAVECHNVLPAHALPHNILLLPSYRYFFNSTILTLFLLTAWRHLYHLCRRQENDIHHKSKRLFPLFSNHSHRFSSCSATFHQESRYYVATMPEEMKHSGNMVKI